MAVHQEEDDEEPGPSTSSLQNRFTANNTFPCYSAESKRNAILIEKDKTKQMTINLNDAIEDDDDEDEDIYFDRNRSVSSENDSLLVAYDNNSTSLV